MVSTLQVARAAGLLTIATLLALTPMASAAAPMASIVLSTGSLAVTEGGAVATYKVHLGSPIVSDVTLTIASQNGQVRFVTGTTVAATKTITFTSRDYGSDRTINVTAVDDAAVEGTFTETITHTASGDTTYAGTTASLSTVVTDNDKGIAVQLPIGGLVVNEDPAAGTHTTTLGVALGSQPTGPVTVNVGFDAKQLSANRLHVSFDATTWNTFQNVVLVAVDDNVAEVSPLTSTLSLSATGADYAGQAASPTVSVIDNDVAGLKLTNGATTYTGTPALGALSEATPGTTLSYSVQLTSQPTAPVTVALSSSDSRVASSASASPLTFTASDWSKAQLVTVSVVDDNIDQGNDTTLATATLTDAPSSADPMYSTAAVARTLTVTVADNDTAGYVLKQSTTVLADNDQLSGTVDEAGAGTSRTYTVVLTSQPTSPVTVGLALDVPDGAVVSPSSLTFDTSATAWKQAQTVTLSPVNDHVDHIANGDTRTLVVTNSIASSDPLFAALPARHVQFNVKEDDNAQVVLASSEASPSVSEDGDDYQFTLALASQPVLPVTVQATPQSGSPLAVTPSSVTFDGSNWNAPATLRVTVPNDQQPGLDHSYSLSFSKTTSDAVYGPVAAPGAVSVAVLDNDGVLKLSSLAVSATEGGPNGSYTVALVENPTSEVTVTLTAPAGSPFTVSPTTLTFEPTSKASTSAGSAPNFCPVNPMSRAPPVDCTWSKAQTVTVTATDNNVIDGTRLGSISHVASVASGGDQRYDHKAAQTVAVSVLDNDAAGFVFNNGAVNTAASLSANEGAAANAALSIRPNSPPTQAVTVMLHPDNGLTVSPTSLTFPAGSTAAQTVTVTSRPDNVDQGATYVQHVRLTSASSDPLYAVATPIDGAAVTVTDDDTFGWIFNDGAIGALPSGLQADEGSTTTYKVKLNSQPTADVVLTLSQTPSHFASTDKPTLTFTSTNWQDDQIVTVTAINDDVDRGSTYTAGVGQAASSADPNYGTVPGPVLVTVNDNDTAGIAPLDNGLTVAEGGATATLHVKLTSEPLSPVTVTPGAPSDLTFSPSSLTFTAANWKTAQPVTVTATDDSAPEATKSVTVTATGASSDPLYQGATNTASVKVNDNDGVLVLSRTAVTVTEGQAGQTYQVHLTSAPSSTVTLTLTSSEPDQFTVSPATLTFQPAGPGGTTGFCSPTAVTSDCTWSKDQTVTVTAVDDLQGELTMSGTIKQETSSDDTNFAGMANPSIAVTVIDNDPSVLLSKATATVTEGGASDTYSIVLSKQPTFSVSVFLSTDGQVTLDHTQVDFDADDWNVPHVVTVTAVDDAAVEGDTTSLVHHTTASGDPSFNELPDQILTVTVHDNDSAP